MNTEKVSLSPRTVQCLSVVFSFRNEEAVLPELIRRTREALSQEKRKGVIANYEMIFVNDASTDRSGHILLQQAQNHSDIRIINMSRCFGVSPCVVAGLEYSTGDAVVYMDADLQDPPEVISQMLGLWRDDPAVDVVHTVRKSRMGESSVKLLLTRLAYCILNKTASIQLPVEAGDFKMLSRRVVNQLVNLKEKKPYMRGLVCWVGFKHIFLPYDREARYAGETKFSVLSGSIYDNFLQSALISFSSLPLKFATMVGFLAILVDFGLLAHVLSEKIRGRAIPGWTAIMIAVIFIGSIQLFCTGMIALYMASIYEESKRRPNFIVESTYGFNQDSKRNRNP